MTSPVDSLCHYLKALDTLFIDDPRREEWALLISSFADDLYSIVVDLKDDARENDDEGIKRQKI